MKNIFDREFSNGGTLYRCVVAWDDEAYSKGDNLGFAISVESRPEDNPEAAWEKIEAGITCEPTEDGLVGTISVEGIEVARLNLDMIFEGNSAAEVFIESIPSVFFGGDPFVGCLIRAGLSSILGQILDCRSSISTEERLYYRARMIAECVVRHLENIGYQVAARTARCVIRCGF